MDTLPLETLEHIFELACVDGGYTGCSLALTSRAIRASSRAARFHSVALPDIAVDDTSRTLRTFLSVYQDHCQKQSGDRPHIRHLHVHMTATNPYSDDSLRDMRTLFRAVAGDLYTLSINLTVYFRKVPRSVLVPPLGVLTHPLQSLRELTVLGVPNPNMIISAPEFSKQPIFPALRRLHVVDLNFSTARGTILPSTNLDEWMAHAPLATHFRVSNLYWLCHCFRKQLARSMGYREVEKRSALVPRARPRQTLGHPHLKSFAVQLCPAPMAPPRSTRVSYYSKLSRKLQRILASPTEPGLRVVLVPSAPAGSVLNQAFAREQWADRIEGGLGCWDVFEDEDLRPSTS